jgi:hypothetical protein
MTTTNHAILGLAISALVPLTLGACNRASGPSLSQPVALQVRASSTPAASATGPAPNITSFRLSVGQVAVGSGEQFGCVDCQDQGSDTPAAPVVIDVPLDAQPVDLATEQVGPGAYTMVEIEVVPPMPPPSGWQAGATMAVSGTFNNTPFTATFAIPGSFRENLTSALVVSSAGTAPSKVSVIMTLPVGKWFTAADGTALDPNDPVQRAQIETNVRASFGSAEANEPAETQREG